MLRLPTIVKPEFPWEFADWVERWDEIKLPNCENFTFSALTRSALRRTLRCHAALIEDLLNDDYDFVLKARFQRRKERRYGQYRQMSGLLQIELIRDGNNLSLCATSRNLLNHADGVVAVTVQP